MILSQPSSLTPVPEGEPVVTHGLEFERRYIRYLLCPLSIFPGRLYNSSLNLNGNMPHLLVSHLLSHPRTPTSSQCAPSPLSRRLDPSFASSGLGTLPPPPSGHLDSENKPRWFASLRIALWRRSLQRVFVGSDSAAV
jgi:hypothetical protein